MLRVSAVIFLIPMHAVITFLEFNNYPALLLQPKAKIQQIYWFSPSVFVGDFFISFFLFFFFFFAAWTCAEFNQGRIGGVQSVARCKNGGLGRHRWIWKTQRKYEHGWAFLCWHTAAWLHDYHNYFCFPHKLRVRHRRPSLRRVFAKLVSWW